MLEIITDATKKTYDDDESALTALLTYMHKERPELGAIVRAWDDLPEAVRAGIVVMVETAARQRNGSTPERRT